MTFSMAVFPPGTFTSLRGIPARARPLSAFSSFSPELPRVNAHCMSHWRNRPGISPEAHKRLFSPFFTTKGTTGTGLGLWLTRDILEYQKGYIRCRNHHSPHGAVFTVWLPLTLQAEVATPDCKLKPASRTDMAQRKHRTGSSNLSNGPREYRK